MEEGKFKIFMAWHDKSIEDNAKQSQNDTNLYSTAVAAEYKKFIELVSDKRITAYFSANDMKGRWRDDLTNQMYECDYAIFVITDDAMQSGWIPVEYGAFLMKKKIKEKQDKNDVFVVSELKQDSKTVIRGPITDTQVFYPDNDTQSEALTPYKKGFLYFLSQIPGWNSKMGEKFELYYNTFRARIKKYKKYGNDYLDDAEQTLPYSNSVDTSKQHDPITYTFPIQSPKPIQLPKFSNRTKTVSTVSRPEPINRLKKLFKTYDIVNMIGISGCGKSYIAAEFEENAQDEYCITGIEINIYDIIGEEIDKSLYKQFVDKFKVPFGINDNYDDVIDKLKNYKCESSKQPLLIIDVNETKRSSSCNHAKRYNNKVIEAVQNVLKKLAGSLQNWKILIVATEALVPDDKDNSAYVLNVGDTNVIMKEEYYTLKKMFYAYLSINNTQKEEYYKNILIDDQLKDLFNKLYGLPILITHLAQYLRKNKNLVYNDINTLLGDGVKGIQTLDDPLEQTITYYLSRLVVFENIDEKGTGDVMRNIVRHFMIWPKGFYSINFFEDFTNIKGKGNTLAQLCLKSILTEADNSLTKADNSYQMHGLIARLCHKQVFWGNENDKENDKENERFRDYSVYISKIENYDEEKQYTREWGLEKEEVRNCIAYSLYNFISVDDIFLLKMAHKFYNANNSTSLYEFALKIKFLKIKYPNDNLIEFYYEKLSPNFVDDTQDSNGNICNISVNHCYSKWRDNDKESGYNRVSKCKYKKGSIEIEGDKIEVFEIEEFKIKMVKVEARNADSDGYAKFRKFTNSGEPEDRKVKSFWIGQTQVTQELWEKVMGDNPSVFHNAEDSKDHPVENVSWYDCLGFIMELNKKTNLKFRLPSVDEWLYAARSRGRNRVYSWDKKALDDSDARKNNDYDILKEYACFDDKGTQKVITEGMKPNSLGIYGMSGNVWEWCNDTVGGQVLQRFLQGGCWATPFNQMDFSKANDKKDATYYSSHNGLRLVLSDD